MKIFIEYLSERPALILTICALTFLMLGWRADGINLDSATYSVIARNMAENGGWLKLHYTEFYLSKFAEHPPLVFWVQAVVFKIFGANDSTARIFGAWCAIGSILLVYLIGREILEKYYGFLAGLILLLTYNFIQISNSTLLDTPMTFFVLLGLFGLVKLHKVMVSPFWFVVTGFAVGLAWLSKGFASTPFWAALVIYVLVWKRDWLGRKTFWLMPVTAIVVIFGHLALDWILADGQFCAHYFKRQFIDRLTSRMDGQEVDYFLAIKKYATLYLPFVVLLPFGIFRLVRERMANLYAIVLTLGCYILFYSFTPYFFYHYFVPLYALSAPIVALPLYRMLKENQIRKLSVIFLLVWLIIAATISISKIHMHELRTPEIYSLKEQMNGYLADSESRKGIFVGGKEKNWDWIAKTAWYWRSDIFQVETIDKATELLMSGNFSYVLIDKEKIALDAVTDESFTEKFELIAGNSRVLIYKLKEKSIS